MTSVPVALALLMPFLFCLIFSLLVGGRFSPSLEEGDVPGLGIFMFFVLAGRN